MKSRIAEVFVMIALCVGFAQAASSQNLVSNGSFEFGNYTINDPNGWMSLDVGATAIADWTVVSSDLLWLNNTSLAANGSNVAASDGERLIELTGYDQFPFGGVEQSFTTHALHRYRLEFDFGSNPARYGGSQTIAVHISDLEYSFTFNGVGDSSQFQKYSVEFVAASNSTLLRFTGAYPIGFHAALDNVSVVRIVPEPSGGVLGVLAVGALVLRRGAKQ